jgi:magnesium chelatase subunit D
MTAPPDQPSPWDLAITAARLIAVDPTLGGICVRAGAGPVRDSWLAALGDMLPDDAPIRRAPLGIGDDRLLGGLDLAATLRAGRPVAQSGVLALADGGVLVLAMAERVSAATAARIGGVMDCGEVRLERDGFASRAPARFAVIALDEGQGDERPPESLMDRLGFRIVLDDIALRDIAPTFGERADVAAARARLPAVRVEDAAAATFVALAARLGIASLRAPLFALKAARAACSLRGGEMVDEQDITMAARLALAPRATVIPQSDAAEEEQEPDAPEPERPPDGPPEQEQEPAEAGAKTEDDDAPPDNLDDVVLAAALAALPPDLLERLSSGAPIRARGGGRAESKAASARRGRPLAARRGELREGRLSLVDTLRAAAPWQRLRHAAGRRVVVLPEDFRIKRFRERKETTAIFVVDASGSAAMQRLAEVKGAIELLLADCYVRRDSVAMVSFRGKDAEIVLPPTRSLARAKRTLAGLPGGGGTPIATGLDAALALADSVRRKGQAPLLVLMTDGRANVALDGAGGRARAFADALAAGGRVRAAGVAALAIDTAPNAPGAPPESPTARIGEAMNARTIRLPSADAARVSEAVRAAAPS